MNREKIACQVIGSAIEVHRNLGPGLLESTYETCLAWELEKAGLKIQRQLALPVYYKDIEIDSGYRIDLLVEDLIILELKSAAIMQPIHAAQLLTYMKLAEKKLGLLLNFNVKMMKQGIQRFMI